MNLQKLTKYTPMLHELRASWGMLQAGKYLLAESVQNPSKYPDFFAYEKDIAELKRIEQKLDRLYDEIKATELLHEAAVLTGNFQEYSRKRNNRKS
ncbi:hypothetical protein [Larkinella soli]|uniref:hypothetical protein n=1 Tax=Larkinella soli TaxID=1770527 RepID=UPI000FFB20F7|nr:hypothetical protein [Larkinella soli]